MLVQAVIVGSELCNGDLSDTHTARFANLLRDHGVRLSTAVIVPDEETAIVDALRSAWEVSDLVLVSGGLGPTTDDLTLSAGATAGEVALVTDTGAQDQIAAWYRGRGREPTEAQLGMGCIPAGAVALHNPVGSAPGVWWTRGDCHTFFVPGVPREVDRLLQDHLVPWLTAHPTTRPWTSRLFRTFGAPESRLAEALDGLHLAPGVEVAYRATFPEVLITARLQEGALSPDARERWLEDLAGRLAPWTYGEESGEGLAQVVGTLLATQGRTLALAESCTGGMLAAELTGVAGASGWLIEGVVTYANESKHRRLGVPHELIEAHGAVSEEVARAMADGARRTTGADLALAITGIAGPTGGSPDKPVGTVHFALASDHGVAHLHRSYPYTDRARNRRISTWQALDLLRLELLGHHT